MAQPSRQGREYYDDSLHIHIDIHLFHTPQREKRKELLLALMALRRTFTDVQLKTIRKMITLTSCIPHF
jgi:hypothetical protein